jgi:hypothetical protein
MPMSGYAVNWMPEDVDDDSHRPGCNLASLIMSIDLTAPLKRRHLILFLRRIYRFDLVAAA